MTRLNALILLVNGTNHDWLMGLTEGLAEGLAEEVARARSQSLFNFQKQSTCQTRATTSAAWASASAWAM